MERSRIGSTRHRKRTAVRRSISALVIVVLSMVSLPGVASAYCYPGQKWSSGGPRDVYMSTSQVPSAWASAIIASGTAWNGISGSAWSMAVKPYGTAGPPSSGGWVYTGTGLPDPGWTISSATQGASSMTWANTYLNSSWTWNLSGILNQSSKVADVRTIMTHEFGHWLRLHHPAQCHTPSATELAAVMTPNFTKKWNLNSDDKAGAAYVY